MSRTINWEDKYCPKGHKWQFVSSSGLFPDYYYCSHNACDRFWQPTVEVIDESVIAEDYNQDRPQKMRDMANFLTWQENLTPKDYISAKPKPKTGE